MYFKTYADTLSDGIPTHRLDTRSCTLDACPTTEQRIAFFDFLLNAIDEYTFTNESIDAYLDESGLRIKRKTPNTK